MSKNGEGILANRDATDEEIAEVMGYAIEDALRAHKRAGVPIAVWDWENNRVVIVPPEEIVVPDESTNEA